MPYGSLVVDINLNYVRFDADLARVDARLQAIAKKVVTARIDVKADTGQAAQNIVVLGNSMRKVTEADRERAKQAGITREQLLKGAAAQRELDKAIVSGSAEEARFRQTVADSTRFFERQYKERARAAADAEKQKEAQLDAAYKREQQEYVATVRAQEKIAQEANARMVAGQKKAFEDAKRWASDWAKTVENDMRQAGTAVDRFGQKMGGAGKGTSMFRGISMEEFKVQRDWNSALAENARRMRALGEETNRADGFLQKFGARAVQFAAGIVLYRAFSETIRVVEGTLKTGIGFNSELENNLISLDHLLKGDTATAKSLQDQMIKLADFTPFHFEDLEPLSSQLTAAWKAAGRTNETIKTELVPTIRTMGDASAALNRGAEGITHLALAFAQSTAEGKMSGRTLMELQRVGVPALRYLADGWGTTTAEMRKYVSKGLIPAREGQQVILAGMQRDFGGAMDKLSQTVEGKYSTLQDRFRSLSARAMKPLFDGLSDILGLAVKFGESTDAENWADRTAIKFREMIQASRDIATAVGDIRARFDDLNSHNAVGQFFTDYLVEINRLLSPLTAVQNILGSLQQYGADVRQGQLDATAGSGRNRPTATRGGWRDMGAADPTSGSLSGKFIPPAIPITDKYKKAAEAAERRYQASLDQIARTDAARRERDSENARYQAEREKENRRYRAQVDAENERYAVEKKHQAETLQFEHERQHLINVIRDGISDRLERIKIENDLIKQGNISLEWREKLAEIEIKRRQRERELINTHYTRADAGRISVWEAQSEVTAAAAEMRFEGDKKLREMMRDWNQGTAMRQAGGAYSRGMTEMFNAAELQRLKDDLGGPHGLRVSLTEFIGITPEFIKSMHDMGVATKNFHKELAAFDTGRENAWGKFGEAFKKGTDDIEANRQRFEDAMRNMQEKISLLRIPRGTTSGRLDREMISLKTQWENDKFTDAEIEELLNAAQIERELTRIENANYHTAESMKGIFNDAFMQVDSGFKGMFDSILTNTEHWLQQMAAEYLSSRLVKALTGMDVSGDSGSNWASAGGILGGLLGHRGGGHSAVFGDAAAGAASINPGYTAGIGDSFFRAGNSMVRSNVHNGDIHVHVNGAGGNADAIAERVVKKLGGGATASPSQLTSRQNAKKYVNR